MSDKQARFYREQAKRCRKLAGDQVDVAVRSMLQEVAVEYDRLADEGGQPKSGSDV